MSHITEQGFILGVVADPVDPPDETMPVVDTQSNMTGTFEPGDPVTAVDATFTGGGITVTREWFLNDEATGNSDPTFSATSEGDVIMLRCTGTNTIGSEVSDSEPQNIVVPAEPEFLIPVGDAAVKKVWVDNDDSRDTYLNEVCMAAAARGLITLVGMSTTSSVAPYNPFVSEMNVNDWNNDRLAEYFAATNSGWNSGLFPIPSGPFTGNIPPEPTVADAEPIGLDAAFDLVAYVNANCSASDPLLILCGGPLTLAADAYLIDNSIASKIRVLSISGSTDTNGYNEWADHFGARVCYERLTVIRYPLTEAILDAKAPSVPKARLLTDFPSSPLLGIMYAKDHPTNSLPGNYDADGGLLVAILEPGFVTGVTRQVRTGSVNQDIGGTIHGVPQTGANVSGNIYYIDSVDTTIGTNTWWSMFAHPLWTGGTILELTTSYSDDFDREDDVTLGGSWLQIGTSPRHHLIDGQASVDSADSASDKLDEGPGDDQFAAAQFMGPRDAGNYPGVAIRLSNSGNNINGYVLVGNGNVNLLIQAFNAGTPTDLLAIPGYTTGANYYLGAVGDRLMVWVGTEDTDHPQTYNGKQLIGVIRDESGFTGVPALISFFGGDPLGALDNFQAGSVGV